MSYENQTKTAQQVLSDKQAALLALHKQLNDKPFQKQLIEAYMHDTGFLRKNIFKREVEIPLLIISSMLKQIENNFDKYIDIKSKGKVAILLPSNGINMMIAKAVCASFLAGNETIIKLPRKLKESNALFRQLVTSSLFNVVFESDQKASEDFLKECIFSDSVKAIIVYGDDKWIWGYKNFVRRTDTKLIFEGPGKDPMIIMEDAAIDLAVDDAISGCLLNGGQSCSAVERFFVHKNLLKSFCERLLSKLDLLVIGHPNDDRTDVGPINASSIVERLNSQIEEAIRMGASMLVGGKAVKIPGYTGLAYLPTLLTDCSTNMRIMQEENFAPVFPIVTFETEEDLLCKVDDCSYGLNASLYGFASDKVKNYLLATHRNVYFNSTVTSACNQMLQNFDGGYKSSGFIWQWENNQFMQLEGKRDLIKELSN